MNRQDLGAVVGGMTYDTYSVENDPSGEIGMALAEACFRDEERRRLEELVERRIQFEKYRNFLKDAERVNVANLSANYKQKITLLKVYFPGRFGHKGAQKLSSYSNAEIGALFQGVYNTAEKKVKEYAQ